MGDHTMKTKPNMKLAMQWKQPAKKEDVILTVNEKPIENSSRPPEPCHKIKWNQQKTQLTEKEMDGRCGGGGDTVSFSSPIVHL